MEIICFRVTFTPSLQWRLGSRWYMIDVASGKAQLMHARGIAARRLRNDPQLSLIPIPRLAALIVDITTEFSTHRII